jgi:hypothetical protein
LQPASDPGVNHLIRPATSVSFYGEAAIHSLSAFYLEKSSFFLFLFLARRRRILLINFANLLDPQITEYPLA